MFSISSGSPVRPIATVETVIFASVIRLSRRSKSAGAVSPSESRITCLRLDGWFCSTR